MRRLALLAILVALAVIAVAIAVFVGRPPRERVVNPEEIKPSFVTINLHINESAILVQEVERYNRSAFTLIEEEWGPVHSYLLNRTLVSLAQWGVEADQLKVEMVRENASVVISYRVLNKVWRSGGGRYTADVLWLLTPLGLDLIESHFSETSSGLFWSGRVGGVAMEINIYLPRQPQPYGAWQQPNGHCHGHIWWVSQGQS